MNSLLKVSLYNCLLLLLNWYSKAFINYSQENGLTGTDVLFRAALLDNNLLVAISASETNYNKIIHYIALYNKTDFIN